MFFYPEIRDENSRLGQRCLAQDARIKQCYPTVLSGFGIAFGILIINTFVCNQQDFCLFDDFSGYQPHLGSNQFNCETIELPGLHCIVHYILGCCNLSFALCASSTAEASL